MLCGPPTPEDITEIPASSGSLPESAPHNSLVDIIRQNAGGPKRAKGDSSEVEQHPLQDQIEVDRYLNSKKATKSAKSALRLVKLVPPGAI